MKRFRVPLEIFALIYDQSFHTKMLNKINNTTKRLTVNRITEFDKNDQIMYD